MRGNSIIATLAFLLLASPVFALATAPANCPTLARTLSKGARGADVSALQQFLIAQGLLSADSATGFDGLTPSGYFGVLTQGAVQKFQTSQGLVSFGTPATTGYGAVGPKTRAAIAQACARPQSSQTSTATTTTTTVPLSGGGGGGSPPPSAPAATSTPPNQTPF